MALVEALDKLAIEQHILLANDALARRLNARPYVTVGPLVRSPVMACCLMPVVDLVHSHDARSDQAGLLLTLTRSIPFVTNGQRNPGMRARPLQRSVLRRARAQVAVPASNPEALLHAYASALTEPSELPENSNCG